MKIRLICLYCGNEWNPKLYENPKQTRCAKCGDTHIKAIHPGKRVDYYQDEVVPDVTRKLSFEYDD